MIQPTTAKKARLRMMDTTLRIGDHLKDFPSMSDTEDQQGVPLKRVRDAENKIRELELWRAAHDAKIDTLWSQQFSHNSECKGDHTLAGKRMTLVERKIYWIAGLAAAAGGSLPGLLKALTAVP